MALTITSVSPASGPQAGGTIVRITGTDLDTVTGVTFDGVAATAFEIENAFLITATVPPGDAVAAVDVTVDDGIAPATLAAGYSYTANATNEQLVSTLARKFKVEVNTGTTAAPTWTPVRAIADLKPAVETNLEDDSDYDGEGWASETKTQLKWSLEIKVGRKIGFTTGVYDPGQEALRAAATQFGQGGTVELRWYDRNGGPEAYQGFGNVSWEPEGGDSKTLDMVTIKVSGSGERRDIVNPAA